MNFNIDYDFLGLYEIEKLKGIANFKIESSFTKPELTFETKSPVKPKITVIQYVTDRKTKSKLF